MGECLQKTYISRAMTTSSVGPGLGCGSKWYIFFVTWKC